MIDAVLSHWGCEVSALSEDRIVAPRPLLEALVVVAFGRKLASEQTYLAMHPDVREAPDAGYVRSGMQHLIWEGLREGRALPDQAIDPERYLALNPDLAGSCDGADRVLRRRRGGLASLAERWMDRRQTHAVRVIAP